MRAQLCGRIRLVGGVPSEGHKGNQILKGFKSVPGVEFGQVILAEQEKEFRFRPAAAKGFDGVDGETRAVAFQLQRIDQKPCFLPGGELEHLKPRFPGSLRRGLHFMRVDPSRHKNQEIQPEFGEGILSQ